MYQFNRKIRSLVQRCIEGKGHPRDIEEICQVVGMVWAGGQRWSGSQGCRTGLSR